MDIIIQPKETLIFSASSLDVVESCFQKYDYGYNLGLKISPNIDLHETPIKLSDNSGMQKGTVGHRMLETYYRLKQQGEESDDILLGNSIRDGEICAATETKLDSIEDVIDAFHQYHNLYRAEEIRVLGVEESFDKVLFENDKLRFIVNGRIDLYAEINGEALPWDHKFEAKFFKKSRLSNQSYIYPWATGADKITINRIGLQKKEKKFERKTFVYTPEMVDEWVEEATYWGLVLYRTIKTGYYPRNLTSCDKFGGCQFKMLCDANPSEREWRIMNFYRKREVNEEVEEQEVAAEAE